VLYSGAYFLPLQLIESQQLSGHRLEGENNSEPGFKKGGVYWLFGRQPLAFAAQAGGEFCWMLQREEALKAEKSQGQGPEDKSPPWRANLLKQI